MDYITLKNTDIKVSQIGFGCCPMGLYGWGETDVSEMKTAVMTALDGGVNLFDTADIYGLGTSEEILGQSLASKRKNAVIATKFGVRRSKSGETFFDNSPSWIETALDKSLKRLKTDYIDLYQIHYWDGKTSLYDVFDILEKKCTDGKIRAFGLSNIGLNTLKDLELPPHLASFQMEYSLANREHEDEIIKMKKKYGLSFLSWGSLGQGILSGKYDQKTVFKYNDRRKREVYKNFHGKKLAYNLSIVQEMQRLRIPYKTLSQIAVRWILDFMPSCVALVGIKRSAQITDIMGAIDWLLPPDVIKILESVSKEKSLYV